MGQRFAPECKYQVQRAASCLGASRPRISLCYVLSEVKPLATTQMHARQHALCVALITDSPSGCSTGTTHIYRSAQASGSPPTSSTSMTPNCCSSALLLSSLSAWTLEEEDGRATSTSFPTSSTLCFMSSTRTYLAHVFTVRVRRKTSPPTSSLL